MKMFTPDSLVYWQITLTLLNVSWFGLLIGLVSTIGHRVLRNSTASRRYWLNCILLLIFAASLPVAFAVVRNGSLAVSSGTKFETGAPEKLISAAMPVTVASRGESSFAEMSLSPGELYDASIMEALKAGPTLSMNQPSLSAWDRVRSTALSAAPLVAILYVMGVAIMLIKLVIGVQVSRHLRTVSHPILQAPILARVAEQARKLSLQIVPVIAYCEQVVVPVVIGLLRPMILIPTAMVSGLTIEQLEAVLTHELAHLRRRDHLMIVVQRVLEAVLFFHPVLWSLSRRIHDERETCCDDLVLAVGADRLFYAQSLLRVAELRLDANSRPKLTALAADGQRPSKLRLRIARLLSDPAEKHLGIPGRGLVFALTTFFAVSMWIMNSLTWQAVADPFESADPTQESNEQPGLAKQEAASAPADNRPPLSVPTHANPVVSKDADGFPLAAEPERAEQQLTATQAKVLALKAHAEAAAMDQLPRFSYRIKSGNGDIDTMRDREECSVEGLKEALDGPVAEPDWLQWGVTLAWTERHAVWSTGDWEGQRFGEGSKGSRQDRVCTKDLAFERGTSASKPARFVYTPTAHQLWEGQLRELAYFRVTPHKFWWTTSNHHLDTISPIPPVEADYRFVTTEQFDDELCDVVESRGRAEQIWIGRTSGRLRGVLTFLSRGNGPKDPFYQNERVQ